MIDSVDDQFKHRLRVDWEIVAKGWQKWHAIFEDAASKMNSKILEMAHIREGLKALDIATGIGDPAIAVARYVGPSGHVFAIDISSQMLSIAKMRAVTEQLDSDWFSRR